MRYTDTTPGFVVLSHYKTVAFLQGVFREETNAFAEQARINFLEYCPTYCFQMEIHAEWRKDVGDTLCYFPSQELASVVYYQLKEGILLKCHWLSVLNRTEPVVDSQMLDAMCSDLYPTQSFSNKITEDRLRTISEGLNPRYSSARMFYQRHANL